MPREGEKIEMRAGDIDASLDRSDTVTMGIVIVYIAVNYSQALAHFTLLRQPTNSPRSATNHCIGTPGDSPKGFT